MTRSLMVFAYDFPNYKTQEILVRLAVEGFNIKYVIGAPFKKLNRPQSEVRDAPALIATMQTSDICKRLGIPYHVFDHCSRECERFIASTPVDIGIIAGAQIIAPNIISQFTTGGIVNTHEALLPWIRGLDTLKWSIAKGLPMANTIHFIDATIDQGKLIYAEKTEIKPTDTPLDVSLRMIQTKPNVLVTALRKLDAPLMNQLPSLAGYDGIYGTVMPRELAEKTLAQFDSWRDKYVGPAEEIDPFLKQKQSLRPTF